MGTGMAMAAAKATENRFRRGNLKDLKALAYLEKLSFGEDRFSDSQLRHLLTRAHGETMVIENNDKIQGAAVMLWRKKSRLGRLYSIVVDPACRGQGLGDLLLRTCEKAALNKGCQKISLEVRSDNKAAIGLYTKFGYTIVGELPGYYAGGRNGVRMVKLLDSRMIESVSSR